MSEFGLNDYPLTRKPLAVPNDQLNPDGTAMEATAGDLATTPPKVVPPGDFSHQQWVGPGGAASQANLPNPGKTAP